MKVVVFDKENSAYSEPYDLKDISKPVMFDLPTDPNNHKSLKFVLLHSDRYELRPVLEGVEVILHRGSDYVSMDTDDDSMKIFYFPEKCFPSIKLGQCVKAKIVLEEE